MKIEVKIFHCGNTNQIRKGLEPFNIKGIRLYISGIMKLIKKEGIFNEY